MDPESYKRVRQVIEFLDNVITVTSPEAFEKSRLAGLLEVEAVSAFETNIKDIFYNFCNNENEIFGTFVRNKYKKLNGRIKIESIKEILGLLGEAFVEKFDKALSKLSDDVYVKHSPDPVTNYDSLISDRHRFVHEGSLDLSYEDVKRYFEFGSIIVDTFAKALKKE